MAVFTMADLHLSLAGENKSMEIFGGRWHDYVNKIECNWNKLVEPSDSVVVPGDISWGMDINKSTEDFEFLNSRLNGIKYILKGNHDYWWSTAAKITRFFEDNRLENIKILHNNAYICEDYIICGSRGWSADKDNEHHEHNKKILKREAHRLELSVQAAKKLNNTGKREIVAFLHYPPVWVNHTCLETVEILERAGIRRCYFGHIHNAGIQKIKQYRDIKLELISADYVNFTPVKI